MESLISRSFESAGKEVRQKYMTVYNNANRMLRLIDELMDFRKIQFNKTKLQVERCSLTESLSSVVSNFTIEASDRKIILDTEFNLSKDEIWIDTSMFEKIVFNLLSNAFKATSENGKIGIVCNYYNSGVLFPYINPVRTYPAFEIIIRDSGFGIKKENLDKVFERFYQDEENNRQNYGGTGIGLEVVSTFIKYHKGKIEVESEENIGTAIKVFFPAGKSHFVESQFRKQPNKDKNISLIQESIISEENLDYVQSETLSKNSLLIVEDNSQLRKYLKSELNDSYKIYEANNGKIGLEIAKIKRPNIIVTDVMMPEMNGIEMCSLLKEDSLTKTIPIVMLTAKVSHKDRILGINSGADVYLKKPFSIELLKSHLEQLLQSKSDFFEVFMGKLNIDAEINNTNSFLTDVISFINENLSNENLVIEDIADQLNISKSKLYRNIKNTSGISANQLIRKLRIERSKELLLKSNFSISEICYNVGFSSPSYFTKRFKEYAGMVPKQFKLKYLNENKIEKNKYL
jgi:DNA-binding response OmpR family regulator